MNGNGDGDGNGNCNGNGDGDGDGHGNGDGNGFQHSGTEDCENCLMGLGPVRRVVASRPHSFMSFLAVAVPLW